LQASGWENEAQTPAQVMVVHFSPDLLSTYLQIATELRQNGIPTQVYSDAKKIGAQMKYASQMGIPYAVIVGPDEMKKNTAIIRDLETRQQEEVAIGNLARALITLLNR